VLVEAHGVVLQLLENQSLKRLLVQVLLLDSACRQCVFEAAAEVFAGLTLMLLVVAQANPAEFVAALRTSHVHAALVLLDRILAPRTRFCVHLYPGFRIIVVALDTLVPLRQCVTVNRSVRWSQTSEAKIFSALAKNVLLVLGRMADRFFALWVGTPLGVLAHVYVWLSVVLHVLLELYLWQQLSKQCLWNNKLASLFWASSKKGVGSSFYDTLQVVTVAGEAQWVVALQLHPFFGKSFHVAATTKKRKLLLSFCWVGESLHLEGFLNEIAGVSELLYKFIFVPALHQQQTASHSFRYAQHICDILNRGFLVLSQLVCVLNFESMCSSQLCNLNIIILVFFFVSVLAPIFHGGITHLWMGFCKFLNHN